MHAERIILGGFLCLGPACSQADPGPSEVAQRWQELGLTRGLVDVEPSSDEHGLFGKYTLAPSRGELMSWVVEQLEAQGFRRVTTTPFDDAVACMRRGDEKLVVQTQGPEHLAVYDDASTAGDPMMRRICFDPKVILEPVRSASN